MKTIKARYQNNRFFVWTVGLTTIAYLIYLSTACANVPIMDYWGYMAKLGDAPFVTGVSFGQIWNLNGIHHAPVQIILLLINVWLFHWNTLIPIYLSAIVLMLVSLYLYKLYKTRVLSLNSGKFALYFGGAATLLVFNLNAWEMFTLEFSLANAIKFLCLYAVFAFCDTILVSQNKAQFNVNLYELGGITAILICTMFGGYFPSMAGSMIAVMIISFIIYYKKDGWHFAKGYIGFFALVALGTGVYLFTGVNTASVQNPFDISFILDGTFFKAILLMLGSVVVHVNSSMLLHYLAGGGIFIACIFAVFLFFKKQLYKRTWLPLMMMSYTAGVICLIVFARAGRGMEYYITSRYVCDTTPGIIAMLWIYFTPSQNGMCFKKSITKKTVSIFCYSVAVCVMGFSIWSASIECQTAPFRKEYLVNCSEIMMNINNVSDAALADFQSDASNVRSTVHLMEKYKLGIFYFMRE